MIHDFNFPRDIYYWGANRFGSFIPLFAQVFYKGLHLSPIVSESITHYLLLIAGFLGFASLFKSNTLKIIFAIAWFLPPARMIDILKLSQGQQYALMGIAVFFINKLISIPYEKNSISKHLYLFFITLLFIISVWVSDLAVITIGVIILFFAVEFFSKKESKPLVRIFKNPALYYLLVGFVFGFMFIYYAKTLVVQSENYYSFFNPQIIAGSLGVFAGSIYDLFLFKGLEPFTSIYLYLLTIVIVIFCFKYRDIKLSAKNKIWITVFSLDLILVFIVIISSKWAFQNGLPRRYFVCNYITFWMILLLVIDNTRNKIVKKYLVNALIIITLIGGLGTFYNFKYIFPGHLESKHKIASEFKSLGEIGIIAQYWNSYLNAIPDPDKIKATPHDRSNVLNHKLIDSVFKQAELFVIRELWMDSFPDTLEQYGYMLIKNGDEFDMGGSHVCNYRKVKLKKIIPVEDLKSNTSEIITDPDLGKKVFSVSSSCKTCQNKYFIFGPYMDLGIGKFKAKYHLKAMPINKNEFGFLKITGDWGKIQLGLKKLSMADIKQIGDYEYVELEFETTKRLKNVEFSIYYYGNADLFLDHILIVEE